MYLLRDLDVVIISLVGYNGRAGVFGRKKRAPRDED